MATKRVPASGPRARKSAAPAGRGAIQGAPTAGTVRPAPPTPGTAPLRPGTTTAGPVVADTAAAGGLQPGTVVSPTLVKRSGNLFDAARPGRAVVRPEDLLALRLELENLVVRPGNPPMLQRGAGSGSALLIVHFPPQSIAEESFFETRPPGTSNPPPPKPGTPQEAEPAGSDPLVRPARARIAGESRLVFAVPPGFSVPYTLEGVLGALTTLRPVVAANALPRSRPPSRRWTLGEMFSSTATRALKPGQRAALAGFAARSLRIAVEQQDAPALLMRLAGGGPGLRAVGPDDLARIDSGFDFSAATVRLRPRPALPGARQTALELPWRLILSPHAGERWHHALLPVSTPGTGRTELWHTRLVVPQAGRPIEPPHADPDRTLRAVWALSGEGSTHTMKPEFPGSGDLPVPDNQPFRMPLDDFDRMQIVHLSSNFSVTNYRPQPLAAHLLMLSSLGAWLDSRGAWEPPLGLSVEEWVHRGSMGRDHQVRVVYKGFLFPFGHRVSLVKITERKFHNGAIGRIDGSAQAIGPVIESVDGNTAFLRQRLFIVVRERERRFADPGLASLDGKRRLGHAFPFSSVRILTETTPNLDKPESSASRIDKAGGGHFGQTMFWPCVNGAPLRFACVGTDLDGRRVAFELPMIFMDNTLAAPALKPVGGTIKPDFDAAEANAALARKDWLSAARADRRVVTLAQQRVALAASLKSGDTSAQVETVSIDGYTEKGNTLLRGYSENLSRPLFYPQFTEARLRIAALAGLGGSSKTNTVRYNAHYLQHGFHETLNKGQVYADVIAAPGMAKLDFSTQGDRSGGFVQPNLTPSALSRLAGPVTGPVGRFIDGQLDGKDAFPASMSDLPLPLLFGCIPLGEVIALVSNLVDTPEQIPKMGAESGNQVEQFIGALARLYEFVARLASQPGSLAAGAIDAIKATIDDLLAQAQAYAAPLVATVKTRLNQLVTALNAVRTEVAKLVDKPIDAAPALPNLPAAVAAAQAAAANLRSAANAQVGGVSLPAGLRQGLLQAATVIDTVLADVGALLALVAQGKALFAALHAIVGDPAVLTGLLENPGTLKTRLEAVEQAIAALRGGLAGLRLLDGAPKQTVLDAMDAVVTILDGAGDLLALLEMLAGDELTIRFDWNPPLASWGFSGADPPPKEALFRANDRKGFVVAVEAKVRKNGDSAPKIKVVCSLRKFDLVLIAPASFIELNFDKIEFSVDAAAKMNVDVLLDDIKFVGPLSFVETLRDLIPLDGFSDPPYLDITPQGIDAGFDIALPSVSIGVFNLSNLSLGAGFTVPFIGQPLSVRFFFCSREQPFNLTVSLFGGGGFFGITLDPSGVQLLEASFEFGASISVDFGVASGGVHVMAGVYFRMEQDACSLTGYFRLGGYVDVLGLISASLELYLELRYEFESGKCVGRAELTITVEVFVFSGSVTISCEKKFAGSNGDPTFRDLMGFEPALPLADELALIDDDTAYPWREYAEAFA